MPKICLIPTGVSNLTSVLAALDRLQLPHAVANDPAQVLEASHVVLPGVGTFLSTMQELERQDMVKALKTRISQDLPTLGVCAGMQVLGQSSQENPESCGLGILGAHALRFDTSLVVPQMGWNEVQAPEHARVLASGHYYFANSYYWPQLSDPVLTATSDYHGSYVAAFERGNLVACQFHPELSGPLGQELLRRFSLLESSC